MSRPGFSLLALPHPALLSIFSALTELADSVALSSCNKELWELGAAARRRYLGCAACGARALEASAAFNSDTFRQGPPLVLADGPSYAVDKEHVEGGCTLGEDLPLLSHTTLLSLREDAGVRSAGRLTAGSAALVWAQHIRCRGCGLHLGLRITRLGRLRADHELDEHTSMSHWRELRVLGVCFLTTRYLRLRAADGREEHLGRPPSPAACAPYTCTAARSSLRKPGECGALLFEQRDILSRQHCWDAGGGPERAFFVNSFAPGAVAVRNERQELLCQGAMRVADVHCATCGARIGWKFCEDLTFREENCNQVGRYGVVKSSIRKAKVS